MYILMDMGTTNTRIWLYDGNNILSHSFGKFGAGSTKSRGRAYLLQSVRSLIETALTEKGASFQDVSFILVSGMAGSEIGLMEIDHLPLPANEATLAENVKLCQIPEICPIPFLIVPGLKKIVSGEIRDMMRGEEVETLGILHSLDIKKEALLILPGSHCKTVHIRKTGEIVDFFTGISGELITAIIENTILKGQVAHTDTMIDEALLAGEEESTNHGLTNALFQIRTQGKNGKNTEYLSSYLYGAVIAQDVKYIREKYRSLPIYIGGRKVLREAYAAILGTQAIVLEENIASQAVFLGLAEILKKAKY